MRKLSLFFFVLIIVQVVYAAEDQRISAGFALRSGEGLEPPVNIQFGMPLPYDRKTTAEWTLIEWQISYEHRMPWHPSLWLGLSAAFGKKDKVLWLDFSEAGPSNSALRTDLTLYRINLFLTYEYPLYKPFSLAVTLSGGYTRQDIIEYNYLKNNRGWEQSGRNMTYSEEGFASGLKAGITFALVGNLDLHAGLVYSLIYPEIEIKRLCLGSDCMTAITEHDAISFYFAVGLLF